MVVPDPVHHHAHGKGIFFTGKPVRECQATFPITGIHGKPEVSWKTGNCLDCTWPNQLSPVIETRILAFAIAHPGLGPRRISASLAQERLGA